MTANRISSDGSSTGRQPPARLPGGRLYCEGWTDRRRPQFMFPPRCADSADVLVRLAIEGVGIVRLGELAVVSAIQKGLLEPLLQDTQEPESYPLWAVLPSGRQRARKVKVF